MLFLADALDLVFHPSDDKNREQCRIFAQDLLRAPSDHDEGIALLGLVAQKFKLHLGDVFLQ